MFGKIEQGLGGILQKGAEELEAPIKNVPITDRKILAMPDSVILERLHKTLEMEQAGMGDESFIFMLEKEIEKFEL